MTTSNTKSRPTHRLYAVTKNGDSKFWQPIGALWAHADGKGFNIQLHAQPLDGRIVLRVATVVIGAAFVVPVGVAAADVVNPPGACVGIGHWVKGGFTQTSATHSPSDVITVPRADTVRWAGGERGYTLAQGQ